MGRARGEDDRDEVSDDLSPLIALLWRRRRLIAAVAVACGVGALAVAFCVPPSYMAKVSVLPQREESPGGLLGQFAGLSSWPLGEGSYEELYARIVKSDRVLDETIARRWRSASSADSLTLFAVLGVKARGADPLHDPRAVDRLKDRLRRGVIEFTREKATGFMELRVTVPRDPQLASALANFLIERLDAYNRLFRRTKASEQRAFVAGRLADGTMELKAAETALSEFVSRNRAYAASPDLLRQHDDLAREVGAQTAVWTELRRQLEVAKIDENREKVSVDVLDRAQPPTLRSSPRRSLYLILGVFLGALGAAAWVLAQQQWGARRFGGGAG